MARVWGKQWMSWIHIDDLAGMIRFAIENPPLAGVLNAVSPNPVRNADFTRELAVTLHRPAFTFAPRVSAQADVRRNGYLFCSIALALRRKRPSPPASNSATRIWPPPCATS